MPSSAEKIISCNSDSASGFSHTCQTGEMARAARRTSVVTRAITIKSRIAIVFGERNLNFTFLFDYARVIIFSGDHSPNTFVFQSNIGISFWWELYGTASGSVNNVKWVCDDIRVWRARDRKRRHGSRRGSRSKSRCWREIMASVLKRREAILVNSALLNGFIILGNSTLN